MNIYIFDHDGTRGPEIERSLFDLSLHNSFIKDIFYSPNVFKRDGQCHEIVYPCLVFIHLGPGQERYGNRNSIPFYIEKLQGKKIAVIAYTAGDKENCPVPTDFAESIEGERWHCYKHNIHNASNLNLHAFSANGLHRLINHPI